MHRKILLTGLLLTSCITCITHTSASANTETISSSGAPSDFHSITETLKENKIFRSNFKQYKKIKILNSPLISEGKVLFSSNKGIVWELTSPIKSKFIISNDKIFETFRQNNQIIKKQITQPGIQSIYTIFQALFTGDFDSIKSNFSITYQGSVKNWKIFLTPLSPPLNMVFKEVELSGDHKIKTITFKEINQDTTKIEFLNQTNKPNKLTSDEEINFDF